MRRRTAAPAGTLCDTDSLKLIYSRQFKELAPLRRHVLSHLPLWNASMVFEPGCGTGLLGKELMTLTGGRYTGMDKDPAVLPEESCFVQGDAIRNPPPADIYITSFFFSSVAEPLKWLRKVRRKLSRGGYFAVSAEYDYHAIEECHNTGLPERIRQALREQGLYTEHGGILDTLFAGAGFTKTAGGDATTRPCPPAADFIDSHLPGMKDLPELSWRVVWGIWRNHH